MRTTVGGCFAAAALVIALAAGCGGSPTGPSVYPDVAGSYSGTATFTVPQLQTTITCPASTSVSQPGGGANVTIAPIVMGGPCGNESVAVGQVTIDKNGTIQGDTRSSFYDETCGGTYNISGSGVFTGNQFRLTANATSTKCMSLTVSIIVSK